VLAALPYALGFLLPPLILWSAAAGGAWLWMPVLALYAGLPVADALARPKRLHPTPADVIALERNPWFRAVTWSWVPVHAALVWWSLDAATTSAWPAWALAGFIVSIGSVGGAIGITFAHELVHRASRVERALGDVVLAVVTYPHFAIEHVHGHHRHVGTPLDPATARLGEPLFRFLPRSILGGARHAWRIERDRLARHGLGAWHPSNRMLRYVATTAAVFGIVTARWGVPGAAFFAAQGLVAVVLLEAINYVEHYGLTRRELSPGRYEPVAPRHSWDSSHRVTNWLLINLARHADHHMLASRRYPALATRDVAPQLPAGYGAMLLLAFVPPLWRRAMDPRVAAAMRSREADLSGTQPA